MATTLEIILEARDNASRALKSIGGSIDKLERKSVALDQKVGGAFQNLAKSLTPVTQAGTLALGGLGLLGGATGAIGAQLISLGADAEEMQAKFDEVFKVRGASVRAALDEFGNSVGRNSFELMGMAANLGDILKPLGFSADSTRDLSIDLVKLATDLSSFNNMPMDEALRRLQGTLVGSHENALAFGVVINENVLKAELAAQGWDKLTGSQLEQAKVQARINLLMKGTTSAQGDALRTSESWTNQMRALKSELTETATTMGLELLPVLVPFLKDIGTLVRQFLPLAVARFKEFAGGLSETLGPAMLLINDALTRIGSELGLTSEEVSGMDVALGALGAVLDAIVIGIKAFAVTMQVVAVSVEKTNEAIKIAQGLWSQLNTIWSSISIPDLLTPGSPTPLELGFLGIANAMQNIIGLSSLFGTALQPDAQNVALNAEVTQPEVDFIQTIKNETQMAGEAIREIFAEVIPFVTETNTELSATPEYLTATQTGLAAIVTQLRQITGLAELATTNFRGMRDAATQAGVPGNIDQRAQLGQTAL